MTDIVTDAVPREKTSSTATRTNVTDIAIGADTKEPKASLSTSHSMNAECTVCTAITE